MFGLGEIDALERQLRAAIRVGLSLSRSVQLRLRVCDCAAARSETSDQTGSRSPATVSRNVRTVSQSFSGSSSMIRVSVLQLRRKFPYASMFFNESSSSPIV